MFADDELYINAVFAFIINDILEYTDCCSDVSRAWHQYLAVITPFFMAGGMSATEILIGASSKNADDLHQAFQ